MPPKDLEAPPVEWHSKTCQCHSLPQSYYQIAYRSVACQSQSQEKLFVLFLVSFVFLLLTLFLVTFFVFSCLIFSLNLILLILLHPFYQTHPSLHISIVAGRDVVIRASTASFRQRSLALPPNIRSASTPSYSTYYHSRVQPFFASQQSSYPTSFFLSLNIFIRITLHHA